MAKRFYVEPRASKHYPWQLVDIAAGPGAVVSIHKTKREAETARYELKKRLRYDARVAKILAQRRLAHG